MIECELKCIKGFGGAATKRIRETATGIEMDVCDSCADIVGEYEVLEEYE